MPRTRELLAEVHVVTCNAPHTSGIEIALDAELREPDREPALDVEALSGVEGEVSGGVHVDNYTLFYTRCTPLNSTPGGTRTPGTRFRRPLL